MRKKVSIALIFVLMLSCLTACGGNGNGNGEGGSETTESTTKTEQVEASSAEPSSGDRIFERALNRTIPEGYEEIDWEEELSVETPARILETYTMIKNPTTEMVGVVDYDGEIVVEPKYSHLRYMYNDDDEVYFVAYYEGERGVVNGHGEEVVPFYDFPTNVVVDKISGSKMLRYRMEEDQIRCITYDVTEGEIGNFNYPVSEVDATDISEMAIYCGGTVIGPNDWIFPYTLPESGWGFMEILDLKGNVIFDGMISGVNNTKNFQERATSDGYVSLNSYETKEDNIFDSSGNIVAGPFKSAERYGDIFLCELESGRILYDPVVNKEYHLSVLNEEIKIEAVFDRDKVVYKYMAKNQPGLYILDLATEEILEISEDVPQEYKINDYQNNEEDVLVKAEKNCFVYKSNNTYKISDLEGNKLGEERYYGIFETGFGVLLKQDNGDWVYVDEEGNLSEETSLFHGDDDKPTTYNDLPIVGYWSYEGTPCVVVEEDGKQVGYAL